MLIIGFWGLMIPLYPMQMQAHDLCPLPLSPVTFSHETTAKEALTALKDSMLFFCHTIKIGCFWIPFGLRCIAYGAYRAAYAINTDPDLHDVKISLCTILGLGVMIYTYKKLVSDDN